MENKSTQNLNGHDQPSNAGAQPRPDRAAINRANAQHSTGPRTEAGKKRSSLNALRHGLTGHVIVMPGEDLAAYERFAKGFFDELQPVNHIEKVLVQTIADVSWKLNRATTLENNLLVLGMTEHEDEVNTNHPEVHTALSQAAAYRAEHRMFSNLSTQTHRLMREREKTLRLLLELQARRRDDQQNNLVEAAKHLQLHKEKELPYLPAEDGFVFSIEEIEAYINRCRRRKEADEAHSSRGHTF